MHVSTAQTALSVKKGDTARKLIISLYADGKPYRPAEGCTAVLTAKKPDGNILYNACTISDGKIAYTFTPQTTSAAGDAECEVRVYDPDEQLITSPRFLLRVDPTVYNDGDAVDSAREVSALTALVSETTVLKNEVERKLADGEFVGAKGDKGDPGAVLHDPGANENHAAHLYLGADFVKFTHRTLPVFSVDYVIIVFCQLIAFLQNIV